MYKLSHLVILTLLLSCSISSKTFSEVTKQIPITKVAVTNAVEFPLKFYLSVDGVYWVAAALDTGRTSEYRPRYDGPYKFAKVVTIKRGKPPIVIKKRLQAESRRYILRRNTEKQCYDFYSFP